ncbi:unnamed protein product [Lampetra fluviatilis]
MVSGRAPPHPLSAHGCRVDKCDQPPPLSLAPAYWSLPPSLHGPKETGPGDTRLLRAYESLQRGLQEAGLPETVDRTNETRLGNARQGTRETQGGLGRGLGRDMGA